MSDILAYVMTYVRHLIISIDVKRIDQIILFGSALNKTFSKNSDIDIFIDTQEKLEQSVKISSEKFYDTKDFMLYKLKGIENRFSTKVGQLSKWKELHRSINSNGLTLYSQFHSEQIPVGYKHQIIFHWDKINKNRGAFLNKIYGYTIKNRRYPGFLEKWDAQKLGKSCVMIPANKQDEFISLLKKYRVKAKNLEIFRSS